MAGKRLRICNRKLHDDLRSLVQTYSCNKASLLTGLSGIKAHIEYKRKAGFYCGKPAVVAPNQLARDFNVETPDKA